MNDQGELSDEDEDEPSDSAVELSSPHCDYGDRTCARRGCEKKVMSRRWEKNQSS
jgi:hypothetical protein